MFSPASDDPLPAYFLGPAGTFCHGAARAFFGATAPLHGLPHIGAIFDALTADPNAVGVVPVENVIEGSVNLTLDTLLDHDALHIIGEQIVPVEQCLLVHPSTNLGAEDTELGALQAVYSHPHALAQCRKWLDAHLPHATWSHTGSTAAAAHLVADRSLAASAPRSAEPPLVAAVASAFAAELTGLRILRRGLQDGPGNATRFLILGRAGRIAAATGQDRTSLVFGAAHTQGALYHTLGLFSDAGLNLCRIESRPMAGEPWQYVFYADVEGHRDDPAVAEVLGALAKRGVLRRFLGSYEVDC